jgi:hypothetical protein
VVIPSYIQDPFPLADHYLMDLDRKPVELRMLPAVI